jgi:hypothetical protein
LPFFFALAAAASFFLSSTFSSTGISDTAGSGGGVSTKIKLHNQLIKYLKLLLGALVS